jgi:PleD family two-component response regulator
MHTTAATRPAVVLVATKQDWTGRSLETILAPSGYVVLQSPTRRDALERAQRDQPDAILISEELPDGDGLELCRQLRAEQLISPSTPVLLILAKPPTRRDRVGALRAGAWACFGDPLDAEELLATLAALVPAKLDSEQARTDGLVDEMTGLYNVRGLTRRAQELAAHASRRHAALSCVLLAPDPSPDGAEGPPEDALLLMAVAVRAAARRSDVIGRLGPSALTVVAPDTDAVQIRKLAERLGGAILAQSDTPAEPAPGLRLRGGCHGVPDFRAAAIDAVELMLRATAALQKARSDPSGAWLRGFDDDEPGGSR